MLGKWTNPRTDKTVRRTGLSCNQYPTGIAPRSSITGSVAKANTTASSGQPDPLKKLANFNPKLEALMDCTAACASCALASAGENAYKATEKDAHNNAQNKNFTGESSTTGKLSSFSSFSRNTFVVDDDVEDFVAVQQGFRRKLR